MGKEILEIKGEQRRRSTDSNQIWAVGGGKGGIGKSLISSSLAICVARFGRQVTIIDLDLGSANLHTCLGMPTPSHSLSDFLSGRIKSLEELSSETGVNGLRLISGFHDSINIADITAADRNRIKAGIRGLKSQYVILDLGAGTGESMIDFFLSADTRIVACIPEPTSIENAYRFIKAAFYLMIRNAESDEKLRKLIHDAMDSRNELGIKSPADLLHYISDRNPEAGKKLLEQVANQHLHILLNQVRTRQDIELGYAIKSVCKKYFGLDAQYLGYIDHDNAVWQSQRKRRPLILEYPYSDSVGQIFNIAKSLLNPGSLRAVV